MYYLSSFSAGSDFNYFRLVNSQHPTHEARFLITILFNQEPETPGNEIKQENIKNQIKEIISDIDKEICLAEQTKEPEYVSGRHSFIYSSAQTNVNYICLIVLSGQTPAH